MATSATRSTVELMLESLKKQEEKPNDIRPALPSRPMSKVRLPSNVRMRTSLLPSVRPSFSVHDEMESPVLKQRNQAAITIQNEVRRRIARKSYARTLKMVILIQAVTRGWLVRRHTDIYQQHLHSLAEKYVMDLNPGTRNEIHPEHKQSSEDGFEMSLAAETKKNLNPNENLQKVKSTFETWKKACKVRLCETKTVLQKLGQKTVSRHCNSG